MTPDFPLPTHPLPIQPLAQTAFGFIQLADVFEDFTAGGRWFALCGFMLRLANQLAQGLAVRFGVVANEAVQYSVIAPQEAVAPAFQAVKAFVVLARGGVQLRSEERR